MKPEDNADTAVWLAMGDGTRTPTEADLRRAVGAIYSAYFRTLCFTIADLMIGDTELHRGSPIWIQAFRSLEHRRARTVCLKATNVGNFLPEILNLAKIFPSAQHKRFRSEYDYMVDLLYSDILNDAIVAKRIIKNFMNAPKESRLEFVAQMVLPERKN